MQANAKTAAVIAPKRVNSNLHWAAARDIKIRL
jgi:hypothetical protein